jgi:hypothetical protein
MGQSRAALTTGVGTRAECGGSKRNQEPCLSAVPGLMNQGA